MSRLVVGVISTHEPPSRGYVSDLEPPQGSQDLDFLCQEALRTDIHLAAHTLPS